MTLTFRFPIFYLSKFIILKLCIKVPRNVKYIKPKHLLFFSNLVSYWEQHKLGDILTCIPFKQYLKSPEQDGKFEIIQQGNEPIIGYANGNPCNDFKDTVIFGDHTLSLYKPKEPFFVATDGVRIIKGLNSMNGNYLNALLEKYKPQSEGYKRYFSILSDKQCYITNNHDEQIKIGKYFESLDNLISLHQRECKFYSFNLIQIRISSPNLCLCFQVLV